MSFGSAEQIATAFGLGSPLGWSGPPSRGEQGEVHRLSTTTGTWAVKRSFAAVDETATATSTAFAEAAARHGVPTPEVRRGPRGEVFVDTDDGPVRVHAWVDLAAPDAWLDPAAVGVVVATMHRVAAPGGTAVDPWYHAPVGEDRWRRLADELSDAGAPFAADLTALLPDLRALEQLLEPVEPTRVCHRDLFADNLRCTAASEPARDELCVIDWDDAGPADPAQELAMIVYDIGCGVPERARLIHQAYLDTDGPARLSRPGQFSMTIATMGHINERACTRWLAAPPGDPERDRMAALFGEFVRRPLTPAVIDETLAALG